VRAVQAPRRSVDRALRRLIDRGAISSVRGGRGHPPRFTIHMSVETLCKTEAELAYHVAHQTPESGIPNGSVSILKKASEEQESKQACPLCKKPPQKETRSFERVEMPPMRVMNEYGWLQDNPEYYRIRGILENASERIRRARNPEALVQFILRTEIRRCA
jgi:hypothetical protein